ncbi:PadR family transcriptional regulator [Paenibacillus filicis]|uniref:PadR family transcriptional regulator n=1 Tax=Paenibacillus filicis TaxID=669464 RepID=A0ABU9DJW9_9BACL
MLKGILEGCILHLISQREVYGYELSVLLEENGFSFVSEGSIYPLLLRMQKEKWITGYLKTDAKSGGPPRKYYKLTDAGRDVLQQFGSHWHQLKTSVDSILAKGE